MPDTIPSLSQAVRQRSRNIEGPVAHPKAQTTTPRPRPGRESELTLCARSGSGPSADRDRSEARQKQAGQGRLGNEGETYDQLLVFDRDE